MTLVGENLMARHLSSRHGPRELYKLPLLTASASTFHPALRRLCPRVTAVASVEPTEKSVEIMRKFSEQYVQKSGTYVSHLLSSRDWQSTGIHWVHHSALAGIMMIRLLRHNMCSYDRKERVPLNAFSHPGTAIWLEEIEETTANM
ncbi:hypothetical protein CASFOL_029039 [Castilleja foliolosa]|uniref:Uncharacterized protein n=1 Tax=Castilleja foliolosa TaxID=1961234 RepID=A0ABD3CEB9_9LAMI